MVATAARRMLVTVLAVLTLSLFAAPAQAAGSSWKSQRSYDFNSSSLPKGCYTYSGPYKGGKSGWSAKDVSISKSMLNLKIEKRSINGQAWSTGGVGCFDWDQSYGKWEIRAKVPKGKGIDSYFGLWSSSTKASDDAWTGVEILAPGTETAYITNGNGSQSATARVPGTYSDGFHTYVIEWAPKWLRITMDGQELYFSTSSYKGERWPGFVVSSGDALTGVPDATTKLPASFQIDSVKTSAYTGVAPTQRSPSPAQAAGSVTTAPSSSATPAASAPASSTTAVAATSSVKRRLAGGIWIWILGGSLIAGAAIGALEYSRHRAHQREAGRDQPRHPTGAGRR